MKYKTMYHDKIHSLLTNENHKTPKMEANALVLRDSIVNIPNRESI